VFPIGLRRLEIHAPALRAGECAVGRVRCRGEEDDRLLLDLEVVDERGRLRLRAEGWEVKRIHLPQDLYEFRLAPRDTILSRSQASPARAEGKEAAGSRLSIPTGFMGTDGGIWWESLACFALGPIERETWAGFGGDPRRVGWLMARLAAKDAVRLLVRDRAGEGVYPTDIELSAEDADGRPDLFRFRPAGALTERHGWLAGSWLTCWISQREEPGGGVVEAAALWEGCA
jgi:hypothetical protein